MFYQCPKCKKTWQYPIEKCPECFLNLERLKSNGKIKVIGISKVNIPSLFHPKVPYFVLVLEDEMGNKWVQKSIKEYKIGEEFKTESNLDKNAVAIWRLKYDILEGIEKVVEFLGGLKIDSKTKILILPTLISPKHPFLAENTSPQFLEKTIQYLIQKGAKSENIKVAAQSFDDTPIEASAQKSQLLQVCQNFKILPLDLSKDNFVKKAPHHFVKETRKQKRVNKGKNIPLNKESLLQSGGGFEISEEIFNSNLVINLPILKIGQASASKNILKFLKKENYLGLKYLSSDKEIFESLNKALPNYLTVAEGNAVQRSDGFTTFLGLILASFNPLNLDRVFTEIAMIKDLPESLKGVKIENIPVTGRQIEELKYDLEKY